MNRAPESGRIRESIGSEPISPKVLLARQDLTREQKAQMLSQWELDAREQMVAEEENMSATGPEGVTLDEVLEALRSLGVDSEFRDVTTKHG
jgi:hypothetical protein